MNNIKNQFRHANKHEDKVRNREVERKQRTKAITRSRGSTFNSESLKSQMNACGSPLKYGINVFHDNKTHIREGICNLMDFAKRKYARQIYYGYVSKLTILALAIFFSFLCQSEY